MVISHWKHQNNLSWSCSSLKECKNTGWEHSFWQNAVNLHKKLQVWEGVVEREMVSKYSSESKNITCRSQKDLIFLNHWVFMKSGGGIFFLHSSSQMDFSTNHRLWPCDSRDALFRGDHWAAYKMWPPNYEMISLSLFPSKHPKELRQMEISTLKMFYTILPNTTVRFFFPFKWVFDLVANSSGNFWQWCVLSPHYLIASC